MISEISGTCEWDEGCDSAATQIAADALEDVGVYCDDHAARVSEEGVPVVVVDCPNCHCGFGVWP